MKTKIVSLLVSGAILLSGCSANETKVGSPNTETLTGKQVTTSSVHKVKHRLIGTSPNKEVKLFALQESKGTVTRMLLDINGRQKAWNWEAIDTGTPLQVMYTDLTGDQQEEAVIMINTGRGTELDTYEVHVIRTADLTEILVPDAVQVAEQETSSTIRRQGDRLNITVDIHGRKYTTTYPAEDNAYFDQLRYGAISIYSIHNHQLTATVSGNFHIAMFAGDVKITYRYDPTSQRFKPGQLEFITLSPDPFPDKT
ncbi:hypothetical protein [Paenibacillus wulumuqiensis]|uniref:hypothetical protein n=1 Tax=Paenibacillus wulumuqiensis TaxID=1567107 RepID=UPI000619EF8A|nr:hypothetical protein [Paenibacillus wulumuqiensis]